MTYAQKFASKGGKARAALPNIFEIRSAASKKTWAIRKAKMAGIKS